LLKRCFSDSRANRRWSKVIIGIFRWRIPMAYPGGVFRWRIPVAAFLMSRSCASMPRSGSLGNHGIESSTSSLPSKSANICPPRHITPASAFRNESLLDPYRCRHRDGDMVGKFRYFTPPSPSYRHTLPPLPSIMSTLTARKQRVAFGRSKLNF